MRVANEADVGECCQTQLRKERGRRAIPRRPSAVPRRAQGPALQDTQEARAFNRAVCAYCGALRAQALRLTKNRSDADDLVQDTLLRAWRYWPRYREQDNCRAWLQRIMLNTFCSERRSYARRKLLLSNYALAQEVVANVQSGQSAQTASAGAGGAGELHGSVSYETLSRSLSALKPEQARVLRLVDMDERSYREAAVELACPVGTVMSRLHRARLALRTRLAAQAEACA